MTAASVVASPPSLTRAIDIALARAETSGVPALVSLVRSLDRALDPISLLGRSAGEHRQALWQQPSGGAWAAGIGSAREWIGAAGSPLSALRDEVRQALANWVVVDGARSDVLLFGGCTFDPHRPPDPEWANFPRALLVAPRLAAANVGGAPRMVLTCAVTPSDSFETVASTLDNLWRESNNALEAPPVTPGRMPTVAHRREIPTSADWKSLVGAAAADIRTGRFDKIVLARASIVEAATSIDPLAALARMRDDNPNATLYALASGGGAFVGASPETLIRVRDGKFATIPLAGSIGRGATIDEDARQAAALLASGKDRHEHEVVVGAVLQALDSATTQIAPVPAVPEVIPSRTVLHLATPIRGELKPGVDALELVARLHPTPAVGGFPKEAAIAAIGERESFDRGWYAGAFGWINGVGDGEFAVAIRSALIAGNEARLYAGCGVMRDSDPEAEYEETQLKLQAIGAALGLA
ncbi:MAG: isochorismate synthase [Thermomicrobiales bacterium]|nr:isochorismate synthase [Thermomicrobiales bacterium]